LLRLGRTRDERVIRWRFSLGIPAFGTVGLLRDEEESMLGTILIVLLVLFLVGALPTWNHSRSWGYFPSGGMGLLLVVVVILLLIGRI